MKIWQSIKYHSLNLFALLLFFVVSSSAFANKYEQSGCNDICFLKYLVESCQAITNEKICFDSKDSKCLRPDFFIAKEKKVNKYILDGNNFQNKISFQSKAVTGISEIEEQFELEKGVSENDISSQKNYIRLGGVECVGKVVSNAAKSSGQVGRVFWSGGDDAMNAAMNYAKSNGMTTLEMTRAGQNLTKLTKGMPWSEAAPMWNRLSKAYAKGARGSVNVFQNANTGVRLNSVWKLYEYPILKSNNVNMIFHNVH